MFQDVPGVAPLSAAFSLIASDIVSRKGPSLEAFAKLP